MGSNDTAEQLAVCHEVNVENEARIRELEVDLNRHRRALATSSARIAELAASEATPDRLARTRVGDLEDYARRLEQQAQDDARTRLGLLDRCDVLEQQVAALEAENRRLETALLERLDHDHRGTAALERDLTDARARLALIGGISADALALVGGISADALARAAVDALGEIRDALHRARPGVAFAGDDAEVALVAFRHLATSLRILEPVTPGHRGHLAPQIHRYDLLGDRIEEYLTGTPDVEEPGPGA